MNWQLPFLRVVSSKLRVQRHFLLTFSSAKEEAWDVGSKTVVKNKRMKDWICSTYDRSNGVGGVDPLKLCAKVALLPSCLAGFCKPPELIGPTFPKAQPDALFTGNAVCRLTSVRWPETRMRWATLGGPSCPYPVFHLVTCLRHLFPYVAIAGLLRQSHRACLLGIAALFLSGAPIVSLRSFQDSVVPCERGRSNSGSFLNPL